LKENTPTSMWNSRYANQEYQFGVKPNDFLVEVANKIPVGKTLCLADGEGRNGVYLAGLGHRVTSIDLSSEGLAKAKKLAEEHDVAVNTIEADLVEFDLVKSSWDSIVSIFFHLPSVIRQPLHAKVANALKPGGVLVLEAYTPDQLKFGTGGPPFSDNLMTLDTLHDDFPHLQFEHAVEKEREVIEGPLHHGQAAVVQLFARKPIR
jgi:SAM-dependent methyltransferase